MMHHRSHVSEIIIKMHHKCEADMVTWVCVMQGWGVAVLVGVPNKDDSFKTNPMNLLNERTLKGTFFGNYKPRTDIPGVVEKYMKKVRYIFFGQSSPVPRILTNCIPRTGNFDSLRC